MSGAHRYVILEEIASGSTATVYLAEDVVLRRKVALKKLHPHLWNHSEAVRRFEKEAVAVASLSHENIIKIYDFGSQDRGLFLAMEYVDGCSLDVLLKMAPAGLPSLVSLSIFRHLLAGLSAAHTAGIYHRDIKPSNVLVDTKGRVRLADFGIAFLSEDTSFTKTGSYLGTPGYSSPEQAQGLPTSDRTDVFSTGVLFYFCLTGRLPFEAETPHAVLLAIMQKIPAKANLVNRRLVPGLAEMVQEMLEKAPDRRPSANQCLEKLEVLGERQGLFPDEARVRRFREHPDTYARAERAEISVGFAAKARRAKMEGRLREAMQGFSMAEIFAEADSEVGREATEFLKRQVQRRIQRTRAWVTLVLLCAVCVGIAVFRRSAKRPLPPVPAAVMDSGKGDAQQAPAPLRAETDPALAAAVLVVPATTPRPAIKSASHANSRKNRESAVSGSSSSALIAAPLPLPPAPGPESQDGGVRPGEDADPAFLWVKSTPPFAKVRLDGKLVGITPFKKALSIGPGWHQVELEKDGCAPFRSAFLASSGDTASFRYVLERDPGAGP